MQQLHCKENNKLGENNKEYFGDTRKHFRLKTHEERNSRKSKDKERRGDRQLTWNMTLYCSSGFWTTHMLHPIVAVRVPQLPQMTNAHTRILCAVFVYGSGRAPPSFAGL